MRHALTIGELKALCRLLIKDVGGVEAAALILGITHQRVSQMQSPHAPDLMSVLQISQLECVAERAIVTGAAAHLVVLAETADVAALDQNADLVHDLAVRRAAIKLARLAQGQASDTSKASGLEVLAELEQGVGDLARDASTNEQWITAGDAIAGAIEHAQVLSFCEASSGAIRNGPP